MKKIKKLEKKIRHNCPTCQAAYILLETHLVKKDPNKCPVDCQKLWEEIITKYCQEKVLGQELAKETQENE